MSTNNLAVHFGNAFLAAYKPVIEHTMVDWGRCYSVWSGLNYLVDAGIPGAFVECGVWKGGVCMLMANALRARGVQDRDIYLYDTFAGMVEPTDRDINPAGKQAHEEWREKQSEDHNDWCYAGLEEVRRNVVSTGYDPSRLHFVQGKVQETIPQTMPDQIAMLRLDTDWFDSTYHELTHLYPRLQPGGVVIFDDMYYWRGQREAVQQYFAEQGIHMMLNQVAVSGVGIKVAPHALTRAERETLVAEDIRLAG